MTTAVPGTLRVSNDCLADLAGYAAMECYGVVGMAEIDEAAGVARLLPTYRLRKGIDVTPTLREFRLTFTLLLSRALTWRLLSTILRAQ